ncbi:hypothetical protein ACQPZJ_06815 [Actinoplanes sp. CA-054009]
MSTLPAEPDREREAAAVRLRFELCPDRLAAEIAAPVAVTVAAKVQTHRDSAPGSYSPPRPATPAEPIAETITRQIR